MEPFKQPTLRLLDDFAFSGAMNMARDEALLNLVGEGRSEPTFRLYQWAPPTISLGYFQKYAEYEALDSPARELAVVRRQTGGGAILHDLELTYSLTLPIDHALLAKGPNELYAMVHDAVIAALAELQATPFRGCDTDDSGPTRGPFFCFARRHCFDVLVGEDKVAGSAQRRTTTGVLQHGSIIVGNRFSQQPTALFHWSAKETIARLRPLFTMHLSRIMDVTFTLGKWCDEELREVEKLVAKHEGGEWLKRM